MNSNINAKRLAIIGTSVVGVSGVLIERFLRRREYDMDDEYPEEEPDIDLDADAKERIINALGDMKIEWQPLTSPAVQKIDPSRLTFNADFKRRVTPGKDAPVDTAQIKFKFVTNSEKPHKYTMEKDVVLINIVEGFIPHVSTQLEPDRHGIYQTHVPREILLKTKEIFEERLDEDGFAKLNMTGLPRYLQLSVSSPEYKDSDAGYRTCKYAVPFAQEGVMLTEDAEKDLIPESYKFANIPKHPFGTLCTHPNRIRVYGNGAPLIGCSELPNQTICSDYEADAGVPVEITTAKGDKRNGIRVRTLNPYDQRMHLEVFSNGTRMTGAEYKLTETEDENVANGTEDRNTAFRAVARI